MKPIENKTPALVGSGIVAGILASICCVGPLVLTILGVSGAAALSSLDFIRVPMIIVVTVLFAVAGYALFKKRNSCEPGSICADPKKYKGMIILYFAGLAIAGLGITSQYWVVWLF
jgi:mercuric ion transport protein